jgi:hypothetical protein
MLGKDLPAIVTVAALAAALTTAFLAALTAAFLAALTAAFLAALAAVSMATTTSNLEVSTGQLSQKAISISKQIRN